MISQQKLFLSRLLKNTSFALLFVGSGLVSCSNSSPKLWPAEHGKPPADQGETSEKGTVFADKPQVDILFVIDDSGSMSEHQQNLSQNIGGFVGQFFTGTSIDYHIGVITTSTDFDWSGPYPTGNGRLMGTPAYVDSNTPNGIQVLSQKMLVGTDGASEERVFTPVKEALTQPNLSTMNQGFYRPNAYLAVIFITDAEDQSTELPMADFTKFMLNLKPGYPEKILSYGVLVPSSQQGYGCPRDSTDKPVRIETFISSTKGQEFGLCDPDFGIKLSAMGKDIAQKVSKYLLLSRKPVEDTIKVHFGTQLVDRDALVGWMYDPSRVAITFGPNVPWSVQPKGTQIEVDFKPANVLPDDQGH